MTYIDVSSYRCPQLIIEIKHLLVRRQESKPLLLWTDHRESVLHAEYFLVKKNYSYQINKESEGDFILHIE